MKPFDKGFKTFIKENQHSLLLICLFAIGIYFRFYGFWSWSFTNDELSALHRINFSSISELINKGIKPDGHPAFTQLFLYFWVKLFGNSEFSVRLPFVISGIGSLLFFYLGAKVWLNKKAALLALTVFACSQYFILYAQIARPYTFGLFFLLGFNYYWAKLIFQKKLSILQSLAFVLLTAAGIMTHYFAALSIILQLFLGTFLLTKTNYKKYLILASLTALTCLPHIGITMHHLEIGGLSWLPKPDSKFYPKFIDFAFNNSTKWQTLIALSFIIPFFNKAYHLRWRKLGLLIVFAFFPLGIGFFYSIHFTAVLQRSVLIFSFPFLVLIPFIFYSNQVKSKYASVYTILLLAFGIQSLYSTNILKEKPFANFKAVSKKIKQWESNFGDQLIQFTNANNPTYFDYYLENTKVDINDFSSPQTIVNALQLINNTKAEYLSLSFGVFPIPKEVHEYARKKFPIVVESNRYYISEAILLKKGEDKRKVLFEAKALNGKSENWSLDKGKINDSLFYSPPSSYSISSEAEYPISIKSKVGHLSSEKNRWVNIEFKMKSTDSCNLSLVVDVKRNGASIFWRGYETKYFYKKGEWTDFIAIWERPSFIKDEDEVSIFIWNLNQANCVLDDFSIRNFADSDYNYY